MRSSTGLPSTKRTESSIGVGPAAAGAAPGPIPMRAGIPPHLRLPRRTWLFAPACGVLVALCAVLAAWHTSSPPAPAGFDLRADPASPNVDSNSATAAGADPAPPQPPRAREDDEPRMKIGPLTRPASDPPAGGAPHVEPPKIELPPLPPAPELGPRLPPEEQSELHRDSPRGDDTMMQVKTLGLSVALAAALTAQPLAKAGDVEKTPTAEQMAKDIKDIKDAQKASSDALMEQLKAIQKQLDAVPGVRKDVDALKDAVRSLNSTLAQTQDTLKTTQLSVEIKTTEIKQLHDDLEKARAQMARMEDQIKAGSARCDGLTEELADLRKKLNDTSRQAARLTEGTGTIRLFNTYAQPVSIVLNGRSYQLDPGASQTLSNQSLGTVTYEVLGVAPRVTRTLTADRPLDIEVYDLARGPIKTPR